MAPPETKEEGPLDVEDAGKSSDVQASEITLAQLEPADGDARTGVRQWVTVLLGLLVTLLFSGPIFGWASWQPLLEEDGIYMDLCPAGTPLCEARSSRMVLLYTAGQMSAIFGLALVSFVADRTGPLFLVLTGGLFNSAGLLVMAQAGRSGFGVDVLLISTVLIGVGGSAFIMHAMKLAFLVQPRYFPLIMTFANCLIDASAVIPVGFYQSFRFALTRPTIFRAYAVLCLALSALLAASWCGAPSRTLEARSAAEVRAFEEAVGTTGTSKYPRLHGMSVRLQCSSLEFVFALVIFVTQVFSSNSYLGLNKTLLESLGDAETDYQYVQIFTALLPASSFFAPLYSLLLSRRGFAVSFFVVIFLNIIWNSVALIPSLQLQLVGFIAFTNYRALLYAASFTFLGHTFGNRTFGTINGLISLTTGAVSFLIWPCSDLAQRLFGNLAPVNVLLLLLCVPPILLIFRLSAHLRRYPTGDVRKR